MLASKLLSPIGNTDKLYVDDVFSAYTYTGNGSTQTINNGIDLAGKGGLVWTKYRNSGTIRHALVDTDRGASNILSTDRTDSSVSNADVTAFLSSGYSLGNATGWFNNNTNTHVSWTFRKAPKFFDIVTYTGNGVAGRQIPHALGVAPGMIVIKRTNAASDWRVWHRSLSPNAELRLNDTASAYTPTPVNFSSAPTETNLTTNGDINIINASYVAYLFAHDTAADGIVQCGSVTGTGAVSVDLGWEPQFVMIKCSSDSSGGWNIFDTSRGMTVDNTLTGGEGNDKRLSANSASAEVSQSSIEPTATGFKYIEFGSPQTFVYLAIRRPNKPPTSGTQVYNAIARTGTGAAATVTGVGFAPDWIWGSWRGLAYGDRKCDRLRGFNRGLYSGQTGAEYDSGTYFFNELPGFQDGFTYGANASNGSELNGSGVTTINHFFKRAPGVFDIVCYTGTGVARTVPHSLGVAPELMIVKGRSGATQWGIYSSGIANTEKLVLNSTAAKATDATAWNSTSPTASVFTVGTGANVNTNAATYVSYLFATKAGISKVGSYTGNGSSQTINCGFSTGARFVLIKRTDSTGDWYVWDTARGIVSANDPHLSLNTTAAEVTSNDSVDPDATGFIVNQVTATDINVTGATYLYLAIA